MHKRIGVYPGTFDPITNGHLDIVFRATRLVDHLIVAVAMNVGKGPLFDLDERLALVEGSLGEMSDTNGATIEVRALDGLLMRFVDDAGAHVIVRGLRAVSDFEYEFQMAGMNARLNPDIDTVFLMASERHHFISSRFVKEIGRLGGDIAEFVPAAVKKRLLDRFAETG